MPPLHEPYSGTLPETAPSLNVADGKVFLPIGLAKDVERVAGAMLQDADTIGLPDEDCEVAAYVQSHLDERRTLARIQELRTVGMPVNELEIVVNGAQAVIDGYRARSEQHLEDKQIPEEPKTFSDRLKKVGASVTGFAIVAAGINSPSGRSARRVQENFTEPTLSKLQKKAKSRKKRRSYKPGLDEWSIALNANSDSSPTSETPVY